MAKPPTRRKPSVFSPTARDKRIVKLKELEQNAIVQLMLFAFFVLILIGIMTAGFHVRETPLTPDQVGSIATRDIRAAYDFVFTEQDFEGTSQRREELEQSTPPVYDWQESQGEELSNGIFRAWRDTREALVKLARAKLPLPVTKEPKNGIAGQPASPISDAQIILGLSEAKRLDFANQVRKEHFDVNFPVTISDETYELFARTGFDPAYENMLSTLVSELMGSVIVPSRKVFENERGRGIYLRRLRGDRSLIEYQIRDLRGRMLSRDAMTGMIRERARIRFEPVRDSRLRLVLTQLADQLIQPNTKYNEALTLKKRQLAQEAIEDVITQVPLTKGKLIVARGETITARHVRMYEAMVEQERLFGPAKNLTGLMILALIVTLCIFLYARQNTQNFKLNVKDLIFMGVTLMLFVGVARLGRGLGFVLGEQFLWLPPESWILLFPLAGAGMLVRLILKGEHAVYFSVNYAILVGVIMDQQLFYSALTLVGCLVGASSMKQVKNRLSLMWSGLVIGVVNMAMIFGWMLYQGENFGVPSLLLLMMGLAGGLLSGFVVTAVLPLFEAGFGYTTDIKLLELSNLNHPLLRELILRAPGSYHHSMMVGSLCEAAAEEIECNPLLARVGAYYHDVGKTKNPNYFAENQKHGENPHDKLKPNMSALIIKAHVKDGIDLAKQHRLPREIVGFIEQHHGTSLIAYFYHRAKQLEDPDIPEVNEKDYRYPGPKPQTRETAICLLADGIEAASRAMPNKTPARLKGLVQTMINKAFTDGQLDECDLTLKDLNAIAGAFMRILNAIYHYRPEYPGPKRAQAKEAHEPKRTKTSTKLAAVTIPAEAVKDATGARPITQEDQDHDDDGDPDSGEDTELPHTPNTPGHDSTKDRAALPRLGSEGP